MVTMFVVTFAVFFVIDIVWLGVVARGFYRQQLGHLMREPVNWAAAFIFYALFIAGLLFFVVNPALQQGSWTYALWVGALFGLICYATYDLTNLATLKGWPPLMAVVDLVWGSVLAASTSVLSFFIMQRLGG